LQLQQGFATGEMGSIAAVESLTSVKLLYGQSGYQSPMSDKDRLLALLAVAIGLAVSVGLWLLGLLIAGGLNLFG
jgi:hypothetical protein